MSWAVAVVCGSLESTNALEVRAVHASRWWVQEKDVSQGSRGRATPHPFCDGHAEGWGHTSPHTQAVGQWWILPSWRLGCFCRPCVHTCCQPSSGRALLPSLGIARAMLGSCEGLMAGGREGLVSLFSAEFSEAGQARAPCTAGSGPCGRTVACVALDGDKLLGSRVPALQGRVHPSPASEAAELGTRLCHTTCSLHWGG